MIPLLNVTITKTRDGHNEYIQIISADQITVNVVVVAGRIVVQDMRPKKKAGSLP